MSAEPLESDGLDPDRPFARWLRGDTDTIVVLPKHYPQHIKDWLAYCGLTAEELIAKHDASDFDNFDQWQAWAHIGRLLEEERHVRPSLRIVP